MSADAVGVGAEVVKRSNSHVPRPGLLPNGACFPQWMPVGVFPMEPGGGGSG